MAGCGISGPVEYYSYRVLAEATSLFVPDSSRYNSIRVSLSCLLGMTSASSFEGIASVRTDTLFQFAVYAREVSDSRTRYEPMQVRFDTTLVVSVPQPPAGRKHYFQLLGANQVLLDSSLVY